MKPVRSCFLLISYIFITLQAGECFDSLQEKEKKPLKFLHLSFHAGCRNEIAYVAKELGLLVDSIPLELLSQQEYDGSLNTPERYRLDIDAERAHNIWEVHKDRFANYNGYIISDIAPLLQVILLHETSKPVIIWICNRFDFGIQKKDEYYTLFRKIASYPNTYIIGYTAYENAQVAYKTGVQINEVIKPIGICDPKEQHFMDKAEEVPKSVDKEKTFYFRAYPNTYHLGLKKMLAKEHIPFYSGIYRGQNDLEFFKGVIHIPFKISNLQLFENLALGLVHFVPSKTFYKQLYRYLPKGLFALDTTPITNSPLEEMLTYSEWFLPEHINLFVTFDSWNDLATKIRTTNYEEKSTKSLEFSINHEKEMLSRWKALFNRVYDENEGN